MIIPIGNASGYQELEIITKDKDGNIKKKVFWLSDLSP
jgi:hypothetical protein